jgi:hypothetical protein
MKCWLDKKKIRRGRIEGENTDENKNLGSVTEVCILSASIKEEVAEKA